MVLSLSLSLPPQGHVCHVCRVTLERPSFTSCQRPIGPNNRRPFIDETISSPALSEWKSELLVGLPRNDGLSFLHLRSVMHLAGFSVSGVRWDSLGHKPSQVDRVVELCKRQVPRSQNVRRADLNMKLNFSFFLSFFSHI